MQTLHSAARGGSRLVLLEALRDRLAKQIDETDSGRDVAALSGRLTDVLVQIEDLKPQTEEVDEVDDLIARPG